MKGCEWSNGLRKACGMVRVLLSVLTDSCLPSSALRPLPLYTGLATGLCGSITSFSTWMLDVFQGFANIDGGSHGGFYNVSLRCIAV